jgi:hypothetical protein
MSKNAPYSILLGQHAQPHQHSHGCPCVILTVRQLMGLAILTELDWSLAMFLQTCFCEGVAGVARVISNGPTCTRDGGKTQFYRLWSGALCLHHNLAKPVAEGPVEAGAQTWYKAARSTGLPCKCRLSPLAQWTAHWTSNPKVASSSPAGGVARTVSTAYLFQPLSIPTRNGVLSTTGTRSTGSHQTT